MHEIRFYVGVEDLDPVFCLIPAALASELTQRDRRPTITSSNFQDRDLGGS